MGILDDVQKWGLGLLNGRAAVPPQGAVQAAPFGFAMQQPAPGMQQPASGSWQDREAHDNFAASNPMLSAVTDLANGIASVPHRLGNAYRDARANLVAVDRYPSDLSEADRAAMSPETYVNPFVKSTIEGVASLPKRLMDANAVDMQHFGEKGYVPQAAVPAAETALMMTGGAGVVPAEANALRAGLRHPFREDFPNVVVQQPANSPVRIMDHPDYAAAKAGDEEAAARVVLDSINDRAMNKLQAIIGNRQPSVVPVHAIEASGHNALPAAYAQELADRFGLPIDTDIVQANRAFRTGEGAAYRMRNRAEFNGPVKPGDDHLLVDDAVTMGGTLADLHSHIVGNNGNVVGATTLMAAPYSHILAPSRATLARLRDRLPQLEPWWKATYGHGFEGLTDSEAKYLASFKSTDAIRDRLAPEQRP